jgi:hypothetical protein
VSNPKAPDLSRAIEVQPKNLIEYNVEEVTRETLSGQLMLPITHLGDCDDLESDSKSEVRSLAVMLRKLIT